MVIIFDFEELKKTAEETVMLCEVREINLNFFSTKMTMERMTVNVGGNMFYLPKLEAETNGNVIADDMYPILFHPESKDYVIDNSSPAEFKDNGAVLGGLIFAILIYLHENARGIKQETFYKIYMENLARNCGITN
ncbi:hypothetical protein JDS79_22335 [Bacillus cereus]|nr:hypothetical protein [Bacillus cereus]